MRTFLGLLLIVATTGCTTTADLERAVQARTGGLAYVLDSHKAETKDKTLALTSFVADDLFDRATTVKRTSTFFLPLVVFNLFRSQDNIQLGHTQLKTDYRQFFRESLVEEIQRSGRYNVKDGQADYVLDVRIRRVDIAAPINQRFLLVFPVFFFFWQTVFTAGPADVSVVAEVKLMKAQTALLTREIKGTYRTSAFGKGALPDYATAVIQAVSLATKDLNENIVAELNHI